MKPIQIIFQGKGGKALCQQNKVDPSNLPFTLNINIGCLFGCAYCYTQGFPFNLHAKFGKEVYVKTWLPSRLNKELNDYVDIPQHLKRVQVNTACEGYLPQVMAESKRVLGRDIMRETLKVFRNHWEVGNHWMVHLLTKSHLIRRHLDLLYDMRDQVQVEMTITTLDERRRRILEGSASNVQKRLDTIGALAKAGIWVRTMAMPFIGDEEEAKKLGIVAFDHGARGFKHKTMNYWDENALLGGKRVRVTGRKDIAFKDLLVNSGEPVWAESQMMAMAVLMPDITEDKKNKRWKEFKNKTMTIEKWGYSEMNRIDWGYLV